MIQNLDLLGWALALDVILAVILALWIFSTLDETNG
jgi:hypothetical protein